MSMAQATEAALAANESETGVVDLCFILLIVAQALLWVKMLMVVK